MNAEEFHAAVSDFIKENCPEGAICMFGMEDDGGHYRGFIGGPNIRTTDERYYGLAIIMSHQIAKLHFGDGEEETGRFGMQH